MSTPWERLKRTLALNAANHRRMIAGRRLVQAAAIIRKIDRLIQAEDAEAVSHLLAAGQLLERAYDRTNKVIEYRLQGGLTTDD